MDIMINGEVSDVNKWNRMSVIKVTTVQMNSLPIEIRKKGLLVYNTDVNDLLVNKGTDENPDFRYLFEEIGSIEMYGGDPAELIEHWKVCNGSLLSISEYPDLFAVIGHNFGTSGNSTHFHIPDYRNKFPRGSTNFGTIGGADVVLLQTSHIPSHTHIVPQRAVISSPPPYDYLSSTSVTQPVGTSYIGVGSYHTPRTVSTGGNNSHNNIPPFLKLHFMIKVR